MLLKAQKAFIRGKYVFALLPSGLGNGEESESITLLLNLMGCLQSRDKFQMEAESKMENVKRQYTFYFM